MYAPETFASFMTRFKEKLYFLFNQRLDPDRQNLVRGLPPYFLKEILSARPLDASIPTVHGGRGSDPHEILSVLEASAP